MMEAVAAVHEAELEERLEALESARSWSPRVVSRLESRIRSGDDLALFRINPKAYASETNMSAPEAVDLFFSAAHVGLFRMEWDLVCASCGNTSQSFRGLAKVDPHFTCELCQMVNDPPLSDRRAWSRDPDPNRATPSRVSCYHRDGSDSAVDDLTEPVALSEWLAGGQLAEINAALGEILALSMSSRIELVDGQEVHIGSGGAQASRQRAVRAPGRTGIDRR